MWIEGSIENDGCGVHFSVRDTYVRTHSDPLLKIGVYSHDADAEFPVVKIKETT